jgi:hypothetical protein
MILSAAIAVASACGGGGRETGPSQGFVLIDGMRFEVGLGRGTVLNTPRAITWAGVAMPALLKVDLYAADALLDETGLPSVAETPCITLVIPSGPDGDFYAGRATIPASLEMQLAGVRVFIPDSSLAACRVWVSSSPLDTALVDLHLDFDFERGQSSYVGSYLGPISFPGVAQPDSLPVYPAWEPADTLFFDVEGSRFQPRFSAAFVEDLGGTDTYSIYAFMEPFAGSPPTKVGRTCLRLRLPSDMAVGAPVPARAEAFVVTATDTLVWSAGYAYGWIEVVEQNGVLTGRVAFQGNGNESAVRFYGGGPILAPIK